MKRYDNDVKHRNIDKDDETTELSTYKQHDEGNNQRSQTTKKFPA